MFGLRRPGTVWTQGPGRRADDAGNNGQHPSPKVAGERARLTPRRRSEEHFLRPGSTRRSPRAPHVGGAPAGEPENCAVIAAGVKTEVSSRAVFGQY
jgi:hypothetical protein